MNKKWNKLAVFKLIFNLLRVACGMIFLFSTCNEWFGNISFNILPRLLPRFLIEGGALVEVCFIICGIVGIFRCRTSYKQDLTFRVEFHELMLMLLFLNATHGRYSIYDDIIILIIILLAALFCIVIFFLEGKEEYPSSVSVDDTQSVNEIQIETATPQSPPAPSDTNENYYEKADLILKYKQLYEAGVITEDDYNAKKTELLK